MKQNLILILEYSGIAAIVLLVFGLGGWYLFLRAQTEDIRSASEARGFGSGIPTFTEAIGSTLANIASGFGGGSEPKVEQQRRAPQLWQVNTTPTAGMAFVATSTLRFLERSTGYLFDADPATSAVTRLSNTLIPKVYEAEISGEHVAGRGLDSEGMIVSFTATLETSTTTGSIGQLHAAPLRAGTLAIEGAGEDALLTLVSSGSGSALMSSAWDGAEPETLLSSALPAWRVIAVPGKIVLAELPASGIPGSAYELSSGVLSPLVRSIPGLIVLPRATSSALLYSSSSGANASLFARASGSSSTIELPVKTLADKCVWAPGARLVAYCAVPHTIPDAYLDARLRGEAHTSDAWWVVDIGAGSAEPLYSPESEGLLLDIAEPRINDAGTYIAFKNSADQSLWMLRIEP